MMHADGYWRDLLTFGWNFRNLHGIDNIRAWLAEAFDLNAADNFRLESEPTIGAIGEHDRTLEFFFTFDTGIAHGRGYARLVEISEFAGRFESLHNSDGHEGAEKISASHGTKSGAR